MSTNVRIADRITILGAALGSRILNALSRDMDVDVVNIERARPVTAKRRHVAPSNRRKVSARMPHIGAKEQERAKRLYESHYLNQRFVDSSERMGFILSPEVCHERCTPTLCQMSKRQYHALIEAKQEARCG